MLRRECIGTGSKGNCYLLETESATLILDAGLPVMAIKKALGFDFSKVVGCVITHEHQDHIRSAEDIEMYGIPVFRGFQEKDFSHVKYGPFDIRAFPVPHDVPCVGYYITVDGITTVYITDALYCRWNFKKQKVHNFLIECNWQNDYITEDLDEPVVGRIFQTHMSEDVCVRFLESNITDEMSNVLICHMSDRRCCPEEAVERIQKTLGENVNVDYCKPKSSYVLERRKNGKDTGKVDSDYHSGDHKKDGDVLP